MIKLHNLSYENHTKIFCSNVRIFLGPFFIFLFVPELASQEDLELLAEMAELLSDKACRERLHDAEDANAVYATIAGWTPNESKATTAT